MARGTPSNPPSRPTERRAGASARAATRLERLAVVLGVCLPVPLFAATGLSIPLPSVVERLAAALVPWAEAATLSGQSLSAGPGGSIVFAPGEGAGPVVAEAPAFASATGRPRRSRPKREAGDEAVPVSGDRPASDASDPRGETPTGAPPSGGTAPERPPAREPGPTGGDGDPPPDDAPEPQPSGGTEPGPPEGGSEPPPDDPDPVTQPVEDAVDDVVDATDPVVEKVEDAAEDPVGTVSGAAEDPVGTVGSIVPGLGG